MGDFASHSDSPHPLEHRPDLLSRQLHPRRREDPQPPRAAIQLFRQRRQIDRSRPSLARQPLDATIPPTDKNVQHQHLRLHQEIKKYLPRPRARRASLHYDIGQIQALVASLPDRDNRSPEGIIGYDEFGLPA